jgi:transcriptional regulator with XRE-family HTH domain
MPADSERAAARYVRLAEEIGREVGLKYGWPSEAARRLGVSQSYLSRLLSKERTSIGLDKVQRAIKRMHLSPDYFYGPREPASYHDYMTGREPPYAAWAEFIATEVGRSMTPDERSTMATTRFHGEPTVALYQGWLLHMRGQIKSSTSEAARTLNDELDAELKLRNAKRIDDDPEEG